MQAGLYQAFTAWATDLSISTLRQKGTVATLNEEGKVQDSHKNLFIAPWIPGSVFPPGDFCQLQAADTETFACNPIAHWSSMRSAQI